MTIISVNHFLLNTWSSLVPSVEHFAQEEGYVIVRTTHKALGSPTATDSAVIKAIAVETNKDSRETLFRRLQMSELHLPTSFDLNRLIRLNTQVHLLRTTVLRSSALTLR